VSEVKVKSDPAVTSTVSVSAPLSPPTLHRRSVDDNSVCGFSPRSHLSIVYRKRKKKRKKRKKALTCDGRVVVGVFSDPLVSSALLAVHCQELEDVCISRR
jgi:hypothetical protein